MNDIQRKMKRKGFEKIIIVAMKNLLSKERREGER
jgi:hypothetical protein